MIIRWLRFPRRSRSRCAALGLFLLAALPAMRAQIPAPATAPAVGLWLPSIFGDHMVLQRGKPFALWGRGRAGSTVRVQTGGVERTCLVDATGRWRMTIPPLSAHTPFSVQVSDEVREIRYQDVILGDVWLGGGQSNMEWKLQDSVGGREAIAQADLSKLRVFLQQPQGVDAQADDVLNGQWVVSTPQSAESFWGVPFFFARKLLIDTGEPIGIIQAAVGGTVIECWIPREVLGSDLSQERGIVDYHASIPRDYEAEYLRWQHDVRSFNTDRAAAIAAGRAPAPNNPWIHWGPPGPRYPKRPFALYQGMIAPLQPYALRGVLWYQGEGNVYRYQSYERLLKGLIAVWRQGWNEPQLPFLIVQMPGAPKHEASRSHWPDLREQQQRVADRVPNVYLCTTIDLGDPSNIHPRDKLPVGERLALLAERYVEGRGEVHPEGPRPERITVTGSRVTIKFAHAPGPLQLSGGNAFALAGADGLFKPAIAAIIGNDSVLVECPDVPGPLQVRCAWEPFPEGFLRDANGLPTPPFSRAVPSATPAE